MEWAINGRKNVAAPPAAAAVATWWFRERLERELPGVSIAGRARCCMLLLYSTLFFITSDSWELVNRSAPPPYQKKVYISAIWKQMTLKLYRRPPCRDSRKDWPASQPVRYIYTYIVVLVGLSCSLSLCVCVLYVIVIKEKNKNEIYG